MAGVPDENWKPNIYPLVHHFGGVGWSIVHYWQLRCILACPFFLCQVQHLESTGSALAEDVIQKSEIIKTYFMETKAGQYHPYLHAQI